MLNPLIWVWHYGSVSGTASKSRGLLQSCERGSGTHVVLLSCKTLILPPSEVPASFLPWQRVLFLSSTGTKATCWSDWSHPESPHVWAELCHHFGCWDFSHSNSESIQEQGCSPAPSCPCPLWITCCTSSFWNSKTERINFKRGFRPLLPEEK